MAAPSGKSPRSGGSSRTGVDAIVIAPVVVPGWTPVHRRRKRGRPTIPVFIADRSVDADPSLFVARVGNDTNLEGRLAASWLAQASRGQCGIVEVQGLVGAGPTIGRKTGFAAVIAQFPGMRIVRSDSGDFTQEGGRRVMTEFIKSTDGIQGHLRGVYTTTTTCPSGRHRGCTKAAGPIPTTLMLAISADGVPGIYRAMLAGRGQRDRSR